MNARSIGKAMLAATVALVGVGCGPSWTVVKQGNPNPLVGMKTFSLEKVSYPKDGLLIGDLTEESWLAAKKPDEVDTYKKNRDETTGALAAKIVGNAAGFTFTEGAAGTPAGESFVVRPVFTFLEPGIFTAVFAVPTTIRMTAQVLDKAGAVVDEVTFSATVAADIYHTETGLRMKYCGQDLGEQLVKYLAARTGAAK